jgi:hypothetical protein
VRESVNLDSYAEITQKVGVRQRIQKTNSKLRSDSLTAESFSKSEAMTAKKRKPGRPGDKTTDRSAAKSSFPKVPRLLAGGNPQIAKGYGDAPVQAYIAAMPSWKRDVGRRLDALVEHTVAGVRKAVKWNSPFY